MVSAQANAAGPLTPRALEARGECYRWPKARRRLTARRASVAASMLLVTLSSAHCRSGPAVAVIGFAYGSAPLNVLHVAQEVVDSTHRGEWPTIAISTGAKDLEPVARPGDDHIVLAVGQAHRLLAVPGLVAVVGPGGSRDALVASPIYSSGAGIPQILPVANARALSGLGRWTLRLAPGASEEGTFIAEYAARELRARAVIIFYVPDEYGRDLQAAVSSALQARGVQVLDRVPLAPGCRMGAGETRHAAVVAHALGRGQPDVVVLAARTPEAGCVAAEVHRRLPGTRIIAGDGTVVNAELLARAGRAADSLFSVVFWHPGRPDAQSRDFVRRFRRIVGRSPNHGDAMGYDALMVLVAAVRTVGTDREAVLDYLLELGRERPAYQGVTGPISFGTDRQAPLVMARASELASFLQTPHVPAAPASPPSSARP